MTPYDVLLVKPIPDICAVFTTYAMCVYVCMCVCMRARKINNSGGTMIK